MPKGIVCDKCNNYFARKIEQPFLGSIDVQTLRFRESIPNKRGIVPPLNGFSYGGIPVKVHNPFPGTPLFLRKEIILAVDSERDDVKKILQHGKIITPAFVDDMIPKNTKPISRFVAKVAFESLAQKLRKLDGWLDDLVNETKYDSIRNYVRIGNIDNWPCNIRRIYNIDKVWQDDIGSQYQIVYESNFLIIPADKNTDLLNIHPVSVYLYFVMVLFGLEFVISMVCPDANGLEPYKRWLQEHKDICPLYYGGNRQEKLK